MFVFRLGLMKKRGRFCMKHIESYILNRWYIRLMLRRIGYVALSVVIVLLLEQMLRYA